MSAPSFASLTDLNNYLATRSYITGFKYSTDDLAVLTARAGDSIIDMTNLQVFITFFFLEPNR